MLEKPESLDDFVPVSATSSSKSSSEDKARNCSIVGAVHISFDFCVIRFVRIGVII